MVEHHVLTVGKYKVLLNYAMFTHIRFNTIGDCNL
ncbi:hypothetical protein SAMN04488541_100998 [Thermoflexibacter ruber]|uniref:Uncharacterized protein n=1 Tax=Thermoflexibacter ruber TaxID=1003 RepID=A0A1I2EBQ7_9BACT|nr:hypothetical protein SAMN04488541_100998 [Thermoflexibacter ruber]